MQELNVYRLFHRAKTNQLTPDESAQWQAFLRSAAGQDLVSDAEWIWTQSADYDANVDFDEALALQRFKKRIVREKTRVHHSDDPKIVRMKPRTWFVRVAASLLILSFAAWGASTFLSSRTQTIQMVADDIMTLALSDGSTVWLDDRAQFAYPRAFDGTERHVDLLGTAYFDIVPDPDRPFVVDVGHARIRVLGTAFNVSQSERGLVVSVDEGQVALDYKGAGELLLEAGFCATLNTTSGAWEKSALVSPNTGAWRNDNLRFVATPIHVVLSDVEEYYGVDVSAKALLNLNCTFTSPINRSIEELWTALTRAYPSMEIEKTSENSFRLSGGKACD